MRKTLLALLVVVGLVAAACGSDSSDSSDANDAANSDESAESADDTSSEASEDPADEASQDESEAEEEPADEASPDEPEAEEDMVDDSDTDSAFPVEVAGVTIEAQPQRILSLSPTATEVLFAIGAGDQVIAVDSFSNYPDDAPTVADLSAFEPNVEAIAEFDPDLVISSFDPGELVSGLDALGIPVILHGGAVSLDDAYSQIEQIGAATGLVGEAAEVVANMQADIVDLQGQVAASDEPLTYFHEIDNTLFSATSSTFIGEIYSLVGLVNIADAVASDDDFGFPQLSEEYVLESDPDFVFLADAAFGESAETVGARPGWDQMAAVQEGRVIAVDGDTSSRWGPRIVDFLSDIVDATVLVPTS